MNESPEVRTLTYNPPGPVGAKFLTSDAFVSAIRGPFGSGKSVAAVMKLLLIAQRQPVSPLTGRRHSRIAVVRNSYPDLKTTTIKTWHDWVSPNIGTWQSEGPPTHRIVGEAVRGPRPTVDLRFDPGPARDANLAKRVAAWEAGAGLDMEVIFVALDRPDDARKLLGMELTAAWINEAREVPKAILDALTGRVGRYPSIRDGGCIAPQVIMDTNPPDSDHWWYVLAEKDGSTKRGAELLESVAAAEEELRKLGVLRDGQPLFEFLAQPSGESPNAENRLGLSGMPGGTEGYYARVKAGKSAEWIKVYVHGEYGFVLDGRPVYPEYRDTVHCRQFELNKRIELTVGLDFGRTPAAVIGQMMLNGRWLWRWEITTEDMGAVRFAEKLGKRLRELKQQGYVIGKVWGDPSGNTAGDDERTYYDILRGAGVHARPATTQGYHNDFTLRREAVGGALGRLIDGEPGLVIHPECRYTRKGMAGAYCFKRVQSAGEERFHDEPTKGDSSHPCEAGQYMLVGGGEGRTVMGKERSAGPRVGQAETEYDMFG